MWLYRINQAIRPVVRHYWRLGLAGAKKSIPLDGPLLLASNHASYMDPWFLGMAFPRLIRYLIARDWYYKSPAWNAFFRAFATEPVRVNEAGATGATVEAVCRILARNEVVGIFPEGRVSRDGQIQRFRPGLARMAARSGAPVMPVGIRGSMESLPRHGRFPRPVRVTIHLGKPIIFPGSPYADPPPREETQTFLDRILNEVTRLAGHAT